MKSKQIVETKTTKTWILEIDEQEAAFLKALCGMQTGSSTESYRKISDAFYAAVEDVGYTRTNRIKSLMTLHPAGEEFKGCGPSISWANGFAEIL
jgi:hypothetical protein